MNFIFSGISRTLTGMYTYLCCLCCSVMINSFINSIKCKVWLHKALSGHSVNLNPEWTCSFQMKLKMTFPGWVADKLFFLWDLIESYCCCVGEKRVKKGQSPKDGLQKTLACCHKIFSEKKIRRMKIICRGKYSKDSWYLLYFQYMKMFMSINVLATTWT